MSIATKMNDTVFATETGYFPKLYELNEEKGKSRLQEFN